MVDDDGAVSASRTWAASFHSPFCCYGTYAVLLIPVRTCDQKSKSQNIILQLKELV